MGQNGYLTFFTTRRLDPPADVIRRLIDLMRPTVIPSARRSVGEESGWQDFLRDVDSRVEYFFGDAVSVNTFPSLYKEGTSLAASFEGTRVIRRVEQAIQGGIPPEVRGNFSLSSPDIQIGYHDLWENAEAEEGQLFARSFLSIRFLGYGTPSHWMAFRQQVFELPEVRAVKAEFEVVAGPLGQVVYWSV